MSEAPVSITIRGQFTAPELAYFIAVIRSLDSDDRHWEIFIDDPGTTFADAEALLREVVPEAEGRATIFETHRKQ